MILLISLKFCQQISESLIIHLVTSKETVLKPKYVSVLTSYQINFKVVYKALFYLFERAFVCFKKA